MINPLPMLFFLTMAVIAAAQPFADQPASEPYQKFLGTWKAVPGPGQSTAIKLERSGGALKFEDFCKQDFSSCQHTVSDLHYDGRQQKVAENPILSLSVKKLDDHTLEVIRYSGGRPLIKSTWAVNGYALTENRQLLAFPESKPTTTVYSRVGSQPAPDDPFVGSWIRDWNKTPPVTITFKLSGGKLVLTNDAGMLQKKDCDGKDYPISANLKDRTWNCRFTDPLRRR